jgi:hypothetical protein
MRPRLGVHGPQAGDNYGVTFERTASTGEGNVQYGGRNIQLDAVARSVRSGRQSARGSPGLAQNSAFR